MRQIALLFCAWILFSPALRATPTEDFIAHGKELDQKFDVCAFHDEVLKNGALPMSILENQMKEWVAKGKRA